MHTYYEVKDMLHRELEDITKKGEISMSSLEVIDTLLNSIKNACKIIMYDEYEEGRYSYGRGRTGNVKRDSLGRYSRDDGHIYAEDHDDYHDRGYSYDGGHDSKMKILRDIMSETNSEEEKEMIRRIMQKMNK